MHGESPRGTVTARVHSGSGGQGVGPHPGAGRRRWCSRPGAGAPGIDVRRVRPAGGPAAAGRSLSPRSVTETEHTSGRGRGGEALPGAESGPIEAGGPSGKEERRSMAPASPLAERLHRVGGACEETEWWRARRRPPPGGPRSVRACAAGRTGAALLASPARDTSSGCAGAVVETPDRAECVAETPQVFPVECSARRWPRRGRRLRRDRRRRSPSGWA